MPELFLAVLGKPYWMQVLNLGGRVQGILTTILSLWPPKVEFQYFPPGQRWISWFLPPFLLSILPKLSDWGKCPSHWQTPQSSSTFVFLSTLHYSQDSTEWRQSSELANLPAWELQESCRNSTGPGAVQWVEKPPSASYYQQTQVNFGLPLLISGRSNLVKSHHWRR